MFGLEGPRREKPMEVDGWVGRRIVSFGCSSGREKRGESPPTNPSRTRASALPLRARWNEQLRRRQWRRHDSTNRGLIRWVPTCTQSSGLLILTTERSSQRHDCITISSEWLLIWASLVRNLLTWASQLDFSSASLLCSHLFIWAGGPKLKD